MTSDGGTAATDHRGRRRVVVTGMGVKSPAGQTVEDMWSGLLAARSAAAPVTLFDAADHSVDFACEVTGFDAVAYVGPKEVRRTDRTALLGLAAAADAIAAATATAPFGVDPVRCGVVAGSGIGGIRTLEDQVIGYAEKGPGRVGPFLVPMMMANATAALVGIHNGFTGPNTAVATACATGAHAIGDGARLIRDEPAWQAARSETPHSQRRSELGTLISPAHRADFLLGATIFGAMSVGLWATFSWLPAWAESLMAPGAGGQQERGVLVMVLGMGGIVGGALSGFLANRFGRRGTLLFSFAGAFVASMILFLANSTFTQAVFVQTAVLALFFGISQGTLTVYIPELFPTGVRATATGICFNMGRIVTSVAVFFVGVLVPILGGYGTSLSVFSGMYLIGFVATLIGRETKGRSAVIAPAQRQTPVHLGTEMPGSPPAAAPGAVSLSDAVALPDLSD